MSDYHILYQSEDKRTIQVVFHYTVPPAATNAADILYTDIAKKCCDLTSQLPNHETEFPDEYTAMQNGEVIERLETVRFSSVNLTAAQKKAEIENGHDNGEPSYADRKTAEFDKLQVLWEWYGYDNDIT